MYNKPMNKKLYISVAVVFVTLMVIGYIVVKSMGGAPVRVEGVLLPAKAVELFYENYLQKEEDKIVMDIYKESPYVTDTFKKSVNSSDKDAILYPSLFCSENKPLGINIHDPVYEGEDKAYVQVDNNFGESGSIFSIELIKDRKNWKIDKVICPAGLQPTEGNELTGEEKVSLFYSNENLFSEGTSDCRLVYPVERTIDRTKLFDSSYREKADAVLRMLFEGPTSGEKSEGYSSPFSDQTAGILNTVRVWQGTAYVDLTDLRSVIPNISASCAGVQFFSQIDKTLMQDGKVNKVIYAINGSPEVFYEFMQYGCQDNVCDPTPFSDPSLPSE